MLDVCSVHGCSTLAWCRGWCQKHYTRHYNHGATDIRPRGKDFHSKSCWSKDEIAWIAGLLEGEGSFATTSSHNYHTMDVRCTMTDRDVIYKLKDTVGFGLIFPVEAAKSHWKKKWTWRVRKLEYAQQIAALVYGHMGERRRGQIKSMLTTALNNYRR